MSATRHFQNYAQVKILEEHQLTKQNETYPNALYTNQVNLFFSFIYLTQCVHIVTEKLTNKFRTSRRNYYLICFYMNWTTAWILQFPVSRQNCSKNLMFSVKKKSIFGARPTADLHISDGIDPHDILHFVLVFSSDLFQNQFHVLFVIR